MHFYMLMIFLFIFLVGAYEAADYVAVPVNSKGTEIRSRLKIINSVIRLKSKKTKKKKNTQTQFRTGKILSIFFTF